MNARLIYRANTTLDWSVFVGSESPSQQPVRREVSMKISREMSFELSDHVRRGLAGVDVRLAADASRLAMVDNDAGGSRREQSDHSGFSA